MAEFQITYEREEGPPRLDWESYETETMAAYHALLAEDPAEARVQQFLEQNPAVVPGAWTPGTRSGHYPVDGALVTQSVLPGLASKRPDFMWIAGHSSRWYPTLIEIERPAKRLFTKAGIPTAQFTQARNQLAEWRAWFASPANVQVFINDYGVPAGLSDARPMSLHMILIYGRREEFGGNAKLSKLRAELLPGSDEELVSFDRLSADRDLAPAITVRAAGDGRFKVVALPPIFGTSHVLADRLLRIDGFGPAIDKMTTSDERKEFLKRRVNYWRDWAASPGSNMTSGSFFE